MLAGVDRGRTAWLGLGGVLFLAVALVVHSVVGTFVFGLFIYYATRPIYRRLDRRIGPSSLAAAVALVALVLPALALVVYAGLVALRELERLARGADATLLQSLGIEPGALPDVGSPSALLAVEWERYLSPAQIVAVAGELDLAVGLFSDLGIFLVHVFVMVALAFYLLRDDNRVAKWVLSTFGDDRGLLEAYARAVDRDLNKIFFGNILNAVVTGTIGVIAYSLLNAAAPAGTAVPAAALVGLLAGVASLVPVVGMKLVYVPVALYLTGLSALSGFTDLWFVGAFVGVSFVVVDTIPDLVLRPYVSGRDLHVGSVMIAYTLGPLLFGWYGIFLMPVLLVLVVHFARVVCPELVRPGTIRPFSVDPGVVQDAGDRAGGGGKS